MHFMPFLTRSGHVFSSSCLSTTPLSSFTISTTTTIVVTIVTIALSVTSVTARVIGNPVDKSDRRTLSSYDVLHKQLIVEDIKKRILDHMGWSEPPKFVRDPGHMSRIRELYRNEIQEFLNTTNQQDYAPPSHDSRKNEEADDYNYDAFNLQLTPPGKRYKVPITTRGGGTKSPNAFSTTLIHFTRSQALDLDPELVSIESATLSMRLSRRHPRQLSSTTTPRLLIKVYLINHARESRQSNSTSNDSVILKSFIVNPKKSSNVIELTIQPHLIPYSLISTTPGDSVISFKVVVTELALPFQGLSNYNYNITSFLSSPNSKVSHSHINILSPRLEVKALLTKDRAKSRSRRSTECSEDTSACCNRKSIYINFADIGLDSWVIAPEGYTAYYCTGLCPDGFKPVRSFSTIKAMMHAQNPDFPAPKCASSSSAPLALMHLVDTDQMGWSNFDGMVVTGCKCY